MSVTPTVIMSTSRPERYKAAGVQYMDERGTRDVTEFVNIAKDDALAWPTPARRTYPSTVHARMDSTVKPFVEKSLAINNVLIDVLNDKLGLPKGTLAELHKPEAFSGCTARVIRAPPHVGPDEKLFLTAHTDFGSLVSKVLEAIRSPCLTASISRFSTTVLEVCKSFHLVRTNGFTRR